MTEVPERGFQFTEDRMFQVSRDGRCLRRINGAWEEAKIYKNGEVTAREDGKVVYKNLPRLVAEMYLPRVEGKPLVVALNGDRTDCRVENLRWATLAETVGFVDHYKKGRKCRKCGADIADKSRSGLCKSCYSKYSRMDGVQKLMREPVPIDDRVLPPRQCGICQMWNDGASAADIGKEYGISSSQVFWVVRRCREAMSGNEEVRFRRGASKKGGTAL